MPETRLGSYTANFSLYCDGNENARDRYSNVISHGMVMLRHRIDTGPSSSSVTGIVTWRCIVHDTRTLAIQAWIRVRIGVV